MHVRRWRWLGLVPAVWLGGCAGSNNLQTLLKSLPESLPSLPLPTQTGSLAPQAGPHESVLVVSGTPTGVYARVARGVLGCWLGPEGPLRNSHVFRAEAAPPSQGGHAAIVLHERDPSRRDQRGARVYRVSFTSTGLGVRVVTIARRLDWKHAEAMAQDVAGWARGREGCRLPEVPPPQAPVAARADKAQAPARGKR